jgi:hypothetical protein
MGSARRTPLIVAWVVLASVGTPFLASREVLAEDASKPADPAPARPAKFVSREAWGSKPDPIPADRRHEPRWITIHHAGVLWTNSQKPVDFIRNMQAWGKRRPEVEQPPRNTFWPDLPYHFLIAPDGTIFEGRPLQYEPESNTKYPLAGNVGVELMGNFEEQRPSREQLASLVELSAWLLSELHLGAGAVRTHRDVAPGQTTCPGRDLYRYFEDGQFRRWVADASAGRTLKIDPGEPLAGDPPGPTESILDTRAKPK